MASGMDQAGTVHDSIRGMLMGYVSRIAGDGAEVSEPEVDSLVQICAMGVSVTGKEDPRELLRGLSDRLLDHIVSNSESMRANRVLGKVHQLFLIEWCHRNGHLNGDWAWRWKGASEGELLYSPKVPLDRVRFPGR